MLVDLGEKFSKKLREVRRESMLLGVQPIDLEDGMILASTAFLVASRGEVLAIDLGAGAGYSSLWIAAGLEAGCCNSCRLVLVEKKRERIEKARRILGSFSWRIGIEYHRADAIKYLESLPDSSIDMIFVDIDKKLYPDTLELLERKLVERGVAIFHNAYTPRPPRTFYEKLESTTWKSSIVPTPQGLLVAYLERR